MNVYIYIYIFVNVGIFSFYENGAEDLCLCV